MRKIRQSYNKILIIFICAFIMIFQSACTINLNYGDRKIINELVENRITTACVDIRCNLSANSYAQGSGAIFYKKQNLGVNQSGYTYYAITNNHVIHNTYGASPYEVKDCYGKSFVAELICKDANYDLAVISFTSTKDYNVLTLAENDAVFGDDVIALGSPLGLMNSVTIGLVNFYGFVEVSNANKDESNVTFKVMKHDAPINTGSSGGVVLNLEYQICGVNYACDKDDNDKFVEGYAIPVTKLKEFFNKHNVNII